MTIPFAGALRIAAAFLVTNLSVAAEQSHWMAMTVDNDTFVGFDNGYTNGIYLSRFELNEGGGESKPGLLARVMSWSMTVEAEADTLETYTLGQIMVTPEDITIATPSSNDLPYSGTLFLNNAFLTENGNRADSTGTTIGIVGPSSGGALIQDWFHDVIDADDPQGWDSQLGDELVFQVSRGRLWRVAHDARERWDLLALAEVGVGNLSSQVVGAALARYGRDLRSTYSTPLLGMSRAANPVAIDGAWYIYKGIRYEYVFNQIFTDGNTFRDSASIDYDRSQLGMTAGLAYSWQRFSITLALTEGNITDSATREFTRFGTLTLGLRY